MEYLKDFFLFEGLSEKERTEIASGFSKPLSFKKGEVIYSAEVFPNAIAVLAKGKAFAVTNNEKSLHIKNFSAGTCFGVAAVFGGEAYVSTIKAETDIEILFITETELRSIFLSHPQTALNYITFLSDKIRFLNTKLGMLSCKNADDTLLKYLSSSADSEGFAQIPKSMTLLSKMLGIGRATLYRCLDNLEENGFILRENNRIKVIKNEKVN